MRPFAAAAKAAAMSAARRGAAECCMCGLQRTGLRAQLDAQAARPGRSAGPAGLGGRAAGVSESNL